MKHSVLFVSANPSHTPVIAAQQEYKTAQKVLAGSKLEKHFELRYVPVASPGDLYQMLITIEPSVVHFSGHGTSFDELLFQKEWGEKLPVRTKKLGTLFGANPSVRLVLLSACHSASQAEILAESIDYAIGFPGKLANVSAVSFSKAFYTALFAEKDLQNSVDNANILMNIETEVEQDFVLSRSGETLSAQQFVFPEARTARVSDVSITTVSQLLAHLEEQGHNVSGYRIAVEAHIFDDQGRVLLQKRGPHARDEIGRWEGVGGSIGQKTDLISVLSAHVQNEVGDDIEIRVEELLEVRPVVFDEGMNGKQDWIIASYLCRLESGIPRAVDPLKTEKIQFFTLGELYSLEDDDLSRSTSRALMYYRSRFGERPYYEQ